MELAPKHHEVDDQDIVLDNSHEVQQSSAEENEQRQRVEQLLDRLVSKIKDVEGLDEIVTSALAESNDASGGLIIDEIGRRIDEKLSEYSSRLEGMDPNSDEYHDLASKVSTLQEVADEIHGSSSPDELFDPAADSASAAHFDSEADPASAAHFDSEADPASAASFDSSPDEISDEQLDKDLAATLDEVLEEIDDGSEETKEENTDEEEEEEDDEEEDKDNRPAAKTKQATTSSSSDSTITGALAGAGAAIGAATNGALTDILNGTGTLEDNMLQFSDLVGDKGEAPRKEPVVNGEIVSSTAAHLEISENAIHAKDSAINFSRIIEHNGAINSLASNLFEIIDVLSVNPNSADFDKNIREYSKRGLDLTRTLRSMVEEAGLTEAIEHLDNIEAAFRNIATVAEQRNANQSQNDEILEPETDLPADSRASEPSSDDRAPRPNDNPILSRIAPELTDQPSQAETNTDI